MNLLYNITKKFETNGKGWEVFLYNVEPKTGMPFWTIHKKKAMRLPLTDALNLINTYKHTNNWIVK